MTEHGGQNRPRGLSGTIWMLKHAQDYVAGVVGVVLILLAAVLIVEPPWPGGRPPGTPRWPVGPGGDPRNPGWLKTVPVLPGLTWHANLLQWLPTR